MSSFSYDRYDRRASRTRSAFTYWVPLALTVTIAAGGIATWIWTARSDHDASSSSDDEYLSYGEESGDRQRSYGATGPDGQAVESSEEGIMAKMSGALRRSPSPQQIFDGASKRVAAGVAAAGAAMGTALSAIREEDGSFQDHERWTEEAELKKSVQAQSSQSANAVDRNVEGFAASARTAATKPATAGKRRTVALVVSAESILGGLDDDENDEQGWRTEEATLLSHLPHVDPSVTNLIVLIYNPSPRRPSTVPSLGSSYAAINTPAQTPGEELTSLEPTPFTPAVSARSSHNGLYDILHDQADRMVEKSSNVMTFSTPSGYTHMLKHLSPDVVYIVDSVAGEEGKNIEAIKGWVGQVVVVVGGDGSGLGGLIDTEDESDGRGRGKGKQTQQWWQHSDMVGLGKGVEIVDGVRLTDDWERRVGGRD